jgi:GNAT superfamily N-acetyltransferase
LVRRAAQCHPRASFELAEDSAVQLDQYVDLGRVLAAWDHADLVGHLQLVPTDRPGEVELKSLAVAEDRQRTGIGSRLVTAAVEACRDEGLAVMLVSTGAASVGNLRFYQRCGFRMLCVERDAFVPKTGYPEPIVIDGIMLRDRVWFSLDLTGQ